MKSALQKLFRFLGLSLAFLGLGFAFYFLFFASQL